DELTQREGHATGSSYFNGRKYVVTLASNGVNFWDWTDIDNPALLRRMILPGIQPSDYDLGAWWLTWAGRYVYVSRAGNGLYIVDATDPANPTLRRRISNADLGTNFRTGSSFVVGNLLVINMNDSNGFATFDLSDPDNPVLLARDTSVKEYSALVNGDKLFVLAKNNDSFPGSGVVAFDISDPARPTRINAYQAGTGGGYLTFQDERVHMGASLGYYKVNVSNPASYVLEGSITLSQDGHLDDDFISVMGNLTIVSDDDGAGTGVVARQRQPEPQRRGDN